ncbi:DNA primase small subunit [Geodia barretti]|uniref:DNA primase n=1 Tax=Geodia barretti TaxID=519541 RepID=A0AA35WX60_GEOBA|nr:DNA primase small subunit [Geodia barretti]
MNGKEVKEKEEDKGEASGNADYDRAELPDLLRIYYSRLFPYDKYYDWLEYGDRDTFSHREFSFTLEDDVYVRYQSFESRQALEDSVRKTRPYKIDVGAIFSVRPSMRSRVQQASFKALRKELVFDIDMTDYDDIRTCCQGANICGKCWKFMTIAIRILDRALREDFGFLHLLWVYSGRRGVHCWVCDEEAIQLSQPARCAIVEYLTLVQGGEHQTRKVRLRTPLHPSISSAIKIARRYFEDLVEEQGFLDDAERWGKMLALVPETKRKMLQQEWEGRPRESGRDRWRRLWTEVQDVTKNEIMLQWCYPRLDANVTKGINHLLKSPLCVHPKTGRICVPINILGFGHI